MMMKTPKPIKPWPALDQTDFRKFLRKFRCPKNAQDPSEKQIREDSKTTLSEAFGNSGSSRVCWQAPERFRKFGSHGELLIYYKAWRIFGNFWGGLGAAWQPPPDKWDPQHSCDTGASFPIAWASNCLAIGLRARLIMLARRLLESRRNNDLLRLRCKSKNLITRWRHQFRDEFNYTAFSTGGRN